MSIRFAVPYGHGMVLQRERPCSMAGTAEPGRHLRFALQGQEATTIADHQGRWRVQWQALSAGGPFTLTESGSAVAENVWVGDVWLCAGQSNMERSLAQSDPWPDDSLALRGDPGIRHIRIPGRFSFAPTDEPLEPVEWQGADTEHLVGFSAVGFSMARHLRAAGGIPQGLVVMAVGGSTVQAWLGRAELEAFPDLAAEADRFADAAWVARTQARELEDRTRWFAELEATEPREGPVPDCGLAWFRKTFVLEKTPLSDGRLTLGTLVDSDTVWVNGVVVGETAYQYPSRRYPVPRAALRAGENEVVVRLVAPHGGLGFTPGKHRHLTVDGVEVDLGGPWESGPVTPMPRLEPATFLPLISRGLYEGVLVALRGLVFRAVVWYQGESNTQDGSRYEALLTALIDLWRRHFDRSELPFVVVQLPRFGAPEVGVRPSPWAQIREAQRLVCRGPGLGPVVTLDLGEANDIHPTGKAEVGRRTALAVRRLVLGEALKQWTGPRVRGALVEAPGRLRLEFDHAEGGLTVSEGALEGFWYEQGGAWRSAGCAAQGDGLVLFVPTDAPSLRLRYGWADNPADARVVNAAGLPLGPFECRLDLGEGAP